MLPYIKEDISLAIKESDIQRSQTDTGVAQSGQNIVTTADISEITATIGKLTEEFNQTRKQIEEMSKFIQRGHEAGIMNDTTHSSVVVRHTGQINLSASIYSSYKLNPNGKTIESSMESVVLSNRKKYSVNDIVLNEHKLNPYLYDLTDMKKVSIAQNNNINVGNLCLFGSVLVKAWERNLKRYVMIRRPARIPMFSNVLNIPEINKGLGVTDPLKIDEDLLAKSSKGYQVNAVVSDSESLINKPGVDPNVGTLKRDTHIVIAGTAKTSGGGTTTGGSATIDKSGVNATIQGGQGLGPAGTGGGQGLDKVEQLISYSMSAGNVKPPDDAITALKAASQAAGMPADWIMAQWVKEVGWDLSGNKAAIEFKNYGNMHGDATKLQVLKANGVQCELAHWAADGTNDWIKFTDPVEAGKGWAIWIRYMYQPGAEQKTAEAYFKCLFNNNSQGFIHSYAEDTGYIDDCLAILRYCNGGTVL